MYIFLANVNIKNMDIRNFINNLFKNNYNFSIINQKSENGKFVNTNETKVYSKLSENLQFLKSKYNILINSDIKIREFETLAQNQTFKSFIIYFDGLVDSISINDFVLEPLMFPKHVKNPNANNLLNYIDNRLLPQLSVNKVSSFDKVCSGINMGDCLLFIDTLNIAFDIDVKKYNARNVDKPENEIIIKGPHESFVENLRTNTSLLRRIINNENLIIENIPIGKISQTKCGICYMNNIANSDLVNEVKYRLNNLAVDSLLSTGQLEQLIEEDETFGVPQVISTERPDKCCKYLLQGRVVILVNGNPYSIIAPANIEDFLFSPEDTNLRPIFTNFLRFIRITAAIITLLLPGTYMAITCFHQEILPTELLLSILSSRENVPFPIIFELLLMEFSFELIREAGLRVPSPIGSTIGIVGALILGDAAVNAGIVSPTLIIIVAITGISSFAIPDFSFGFHLRIFRFIFIALGFACGFLGIGTGLFVYITLICSLNSFGIPFTSPISPSLKTNGNGYFIPPIWKQEYRAGFLSPKKEKSQANISMKWKY